MDYKSKFRFFASKKINQTPKQLIGLLRGFRLFNCKFSVLNGNVYRVALAELVAQYLTRYQRFEIALHITLQRSCAEARVVALVNDELLCFLGDVKPELLFFEALCEVCRLQVDNAEYLRFGERLVEHDLVETVQKFGSKRLLQDLVDMVASVLGDVSAVVYAVKDKLRA